MTCFGIDVYEKEGQLYPEDKYEKLLLFDDYHKQQTDSSIECSQTIDQIEDESKQLIIMDRRIFHDDRELSDDQIDYGQVLLTKK